MHLALFTLSIATLSFAPQDVSDLQLVDRVEVIVNDEILTYRQVLKAAAQRIPEGVSPTARQLVELRRMVGNELVDEHLKVQGGIDMGFEEDVVKRIVANNTHRRIGTAGGVIKMADELDSGGSSLFEQEKRLRRNLYRFSWERAVTGSNVGVSGRAYRDRYVRPGQLKLRYERLENGQLGAEAIKGTSARYHLQEHIFRIHDEKDSEASRLRAEEMRERLRGNLGFTEAVRISPDPPENDGMLPILSGADLMQRRETEIAAFAISAKPGEVSRPIPILLGRRIAGWRLIKLLDSDAPLLPIFDVPRTQTLLRSSIQDEGDDYWRSKGLEGLNQGAFIWVSGSDKG